jgi:glycosyltransferase involved in cell wall biosynthesis
MNRRALLLSSVMLRGYGVSVVADEIEKRISHHGWDLYIGCLNVDDHFRSPRVQQIAADPQAIASFCRKNGIEVIAAQTSPYFEALPALTGEFKTLVYEHGDPSPFFFSQDATERENIRQHKIREVYANVTKVSASSHFLVQDIEWKDTTVCYLGADHVKDLGPKTIADVAHRSSRPLRVGTLMRLGVGEAKYKGNEIFLDIVRQLRLDGKVEAAVMGRGDNDDAEFWKSEGVEVFLNSPDEEKGEYLRGLDVFISASQWEGFNLPLVEAQALGTVGLAFDVGAHPETTLFVATSTDDALSMIRYWADHRDSLQIASNLSYRYVRNKYKWDETAQNFATLLTATAGNTALGRVPTLRGASISAPSRVTRLLRLVRREGPFKACVVVARKIQKRMGH